jgi:hypothetical protein
LNYLGNPALAESSKTTLEDESNIYPKDTQKAHVVFGWKLLTLEEMYPEDDMPLVEP